MGSAKPGRISSIITASSIANKQKRQSVYLAQKKASWKNKHDERRARRREEDKNPELRAERLARNKTVTIEDKREWDTTDNDDLGAVVDVMALRRRQLQEEESRAVEEADASLSAAEDGQDDDGQGDGHDDDFDSMLGSDEGEEMDEDERTDSKTPRRTSSLAPSVTASIAPSITSTQFDLTPAALVRQFPVLYDDGLRQPKILVTTSLRATIHDEVREIANIFPNSTYIKRSAHHYSHNYAIREIATFAQNRGYTALVVIKEDLKKPTTMTVVHLHGECNGPTLTYSITNFMPGKKLPGHGNPTNHYPELLLNNFKTPLGLLAARSWYCMFPPAPELQGRQCTTLHNQRDFIFVRRHRYVFRDKRPTEKSVSGTDGKTMPGVEGIRAGLQEIGPRFTLKLRRVDKGVGLGGSEGEDSLPWKWKTKMDVKRTRFNL